MAAAADALMPMSAPDSEPQSQNASPARERLRRRWLDEALGAASGPLTAASADAGFRSYWRAQTANGSVIVMDSPPALEDVRPWLEMHAILNSGGVRVPRILAQEVDHGFLLLEDLGQATLLDMLDEDNADAWFAAALTQLLKIQAIIPAADFPAYDRALLERDLGLFADWFLDRHLGLTLTGDEADALARVNRFLIERALAQPRVLVHRDFMPRNLMPADPGPAVIDFQGAVRGPIAYDPISLFRDAFVSWPHERVEGWLHDYHRRAVDAGLPVPDWSCFRTDADCCGVHRHLKILGIFARLRHRDDKPHYLDDAESFLGYLEQVTVRYPELHALGDLIERRIRPALVETAEPAR